jgi:nitrite reductase (NADH) large subunit
VDYLKYVILGNSAAGFFAATKLRDICEDDEIVVISRENTPVYSKIMLPYYIGNEITRDKLFLKDKDFYDKKHIKLVLDKKIMGIDTEKNIIIGEDGWSMAYDKLLIATGGRPFIPPIDGIDKVEFFTINSIEDADRIKGCAQTGGRAIVLGSGLTGIEMSIALSNLGMHVTMLEMGDRILPMQLDNDASNIMETQLKKLGISTMLKNTIHKVYITDEGIKRTELMDGQQLEFDLLLLAIGTRPDLSIIEGTSIKHNRGILVNEYMETSIKNIYAAGDIAEIKSDKNEGYVSSYIWPNAMAQGRCAASNMAGNHESFDGAAFQNVVQIRNMDFYSMGLIKPNDDGYDILINYDKNNGIYKKIVIKDNAILGMVMLGDTLHTTEISNIIKNNRQVSKEQLDTYLSIR